MKYFLPTLRTIKRQIFIALLLVLTFLGLTPIVTFATFADDFASKREIFLRRSKGAVLYDRNSKPFFTLFEGKTVNYIDIDLIPKHVQHAVVVAEDENFFHHNGFSPRSILMAGIANLRSGELTYGGSTITQQLIKNTFLKGDKNFVRKYQEIILAKELEQRLSKEEILELYLNTAYFGEGAYGIGQAAYVYFDKSQEQLTLSESATLAGLLVAPSRLSPLSHTADEWQKRQAYVLDEMVEDRYITAKERDQALETKLKFNSAPLDVTVNQAPHFALLVKQQLIDEFGEERLAQSGFRVYTTLDLSMQHFTENAVKDQVLRLGRQNATNGAAVVMDPKTGEVLSLVGSYDWFDDRWGKFNVATSPRQPGSSFKPIVYLAAFEHHNITPATVLSDKPVTLARGYKPQNYDGRFRGPVTARYALANSLNVPSVEVITRVGIENTLDMARTLGISTLRDPVNYGPSLVLGSGEVTLLELTNAYATIANSGVRNDPVFITEIEDKFGKTIYRHEPDSREVVDPEYTYLVSSILSDSKARTPMFGNALNISRPAAVKTGTTQDYRDAWTLGYTPSLAVGVWVGNNDNRPMSRVAGSLGAAPIWRTLMEKFLAGTPVESFDTPGSITKRRVCPGATYFGSGEEIFASGTAPAECIPTPTPTPDPSQPTSTPPVPSPPPQDTSGPTNTEFQIQQINAEIEKHHQDKDKEKSEDKED